MFSLTRKKTRTAPQITTPSGDVARVVIDESGAIVYASQAFRALSHMREEEPGRLPAASVLHFVDNGIADFSEIGAGLHKIQLNGHKEPREFHFDWLITPDRRRYLLASETQGDTLPQAVLQEFESQLLKTRIRKAAPSVARKSTQAPDDLQCFADMTPDVMIVAGEFGEIKSVNAAFRTAFGYEESDLANMDFIDLFHDEDRPYIRNTLQALALEFEQNGEIENTGIDFEARIRTKDGQERWMEWQQKRHGADTYCLGRDVTALKRQKQALARREKQLLEAESIGRMGHWSWTVGSQTIEWSAEIYRIFGLDSKNFTPTFESMSACVHRHDMGRVNQAFQRAIIEQNDYDMEFRVLRPDGETRFIRCEGRCALDEQGDVTALYGIMQDMTERMLYERELKEAKDAAERAYAAKSQFLANMSHELRTPLNAIIGFSEIMQSQLLGPIGTEKYLEYVQGIHESGGHLLDLISDILDMSKIEAGKYELDLEEINVAKTIRVAVHMIESRAVEARLKIGIDPALNEKLNIIADRRALLQIMLNLLSNAVKFTKSGGHIRIECCERPEFVAIKVIDNGIGIPANKLASITRPFEQVSSHYTREHEGSGLGLAITKELAELHGGSLQIDSEVGAGTTVTVRLPYKAKMKKRKKA